MFEHSSFAFPKEPVPPVIMSVVLVNISRGSVIPLFVEQIKAGTPLTITDPNMTRFLMNMDEAVDLVLFAFQNASPGDIVAQKAPASTIGDLAQALRELFCADNPISYIGIRHGEKLHETLLTREECFRATDFGDFYCVSADNRDLNYEQFIEQGKTTMPVIEEFNSNNTEQLNIEQIKEKLLASEYIRRELAI